MDQLSDELVATLKIRAEDPARRCNMAALAAQSVGIDQLLGGLPRSNDPKVREYLEGINSPFAGMISNLATGDGNQAKALLGALSAALGNRQVFGVMGGTTFSMGTRQEPSKAPAPANEEQLAAVEAALGIPLPGQLRQFYAEVANGGVGPGAGLYSLNEIAAKYHELTSEPVGPDQEAWPLNLLPIAGADEQLFSIDRESGSILCWDAEELDFDEDAPADSSAWAASFRPEAESLGEWLASSVARSPGAAIGA